ncbi:hypothetical protein GF385_03060 [Candidatus Dependentiae bacterium]|nr:hypothetical protein [Candidatus Dependentiae bacterium]
MIKKIFLFLIIILYPFQSFNFPNYAKRDLFQSKNISNYKNYFSNNSIFYIDKKTGLSYLHIAAGFGNYKLVKFLLDKKLDCKLKDNFGFSPIDWAFIGNCRKVIDLFKKREIKLYSKFKRLYFGIDKGIILPRYSYILLDTILFDNEENSLKRCYYIARMFKLNKLKEYLLKNFDINKDLMSCDEYGMNAIHESVIWGDYLLVKHFCELGIDYNKKDHKGRTPLDWAEINGNFVVFEYLMENILDKEPWWKFW